MRLLNYWHIWKILALNAFQETFINRGTNSLFIAGKAIRFGMTLLFIWILKNNIQIFANYSPDQLVIFFLTYHFIDTITQTFFRGVYRFSFEVRSGDFDFYLIRPVSPLFQALAGRPDINDAFFLIPSFMVAFLMIQHLNLNISLISTIWFICLFLNGLLIGTAFHIIVLAVGILTTEVEGIIWLYRDLGKLGQFPVSIYMEGLRFALFFIVPIGMMVTIPAQFLLQTPPSYSAVTACLIGIGFFIFSLKFWQYSLRQYSSASS